MCGDGSFLMMSSEIVTSIPRGCQKLIIVLVDNHGYQCILDLARDRGVPRLRQRAAVPRSGHRAGSTGDYVPIDFRQHAESMGARRRRRAARPTRSARRLPGPARRDRPHGRRRPDVAPTSRVPGMEGWWDVPVAEVSGQDNVHEARDRYEHSLALQRRDLL